MWCWYVKIEQPPLSEDPDRAAYQKVAGDQYGSYFVGAKDVVEAAKFAQEVLDRALPGVTTPIITSIQRYNLPDATESA